MYSKVTSISDCRQLQLDLDCFCLFTRRLGLTLNLNKCHSITFDRKRKPIIFIYSLNDSPLEHVSSVKDLGFYLAPSLSFEEHINITVVITKTRYQKKTGPRLNSDKTVATVRIVLCTVEIRSLTTRQSLRFVYACIFSLK
ncbi:hypothetical protein QTP88_019811 [Uroleucon formosanum]